MYQNQDILNINSQNSKFEITVRQTDQKFGRFTNKLPKVLNYAVKFCSSLLQNWFGGKSLAGYTTAIMIWVIISGKIH